MDVEAALLRRLPRPLRRPARRLLYLPGDLRDRVLGRRGPMVPPRGRSFVGAGDFTAVGEEFLRHFRGLGGLRPDARVLDVGCGIGRMAVPLTRYLSPGGCYDGFDVVREDVAWCRRHIGRRHPSFRFHHADVWNGNYNWRGRIRAEEYTFPFPDASFDFAFATSVFTHLLPGALERYLAETARVLAPGGTCLITFFLLDDEARDAMEAGRCGLRFVHPIGPARVHDLADPEGAVAYEENFLRDLHETHGLAIAEPIHRGSWSGREGAVSYQDLIVAVRKEDKLSRNG